MQPPSWIREALDGYRWLWRAQLRWSRGPLWVTWIRFGLRIADDIGRGALVALLSGSTPRADLATAGVAIQGRSNMAMPYPSQGILDVSANERLKAGFDSWLWTSIMLATAIHFATFAFWPEMATTDMGIEVGLPTRLVPPPKVDIPEAPKRLERPAMPIAAPVELNEDLTIGPTTFDHNPVDLLPPPPDNVASQTATPSKFFPFTVAPRVLNTDEVVRSMEREYPTVLRDSGIGGTVSVTFSIDEDGRVMDTVVGQSSGYAALDDAALKVAEVIRFSPAMNRERQVAVQVAFPIVFRVGGSR